MTPDQVAQFIEQARGIARDAMLKLSAEDKSQALARLNAARDLPDATQPRVVISIALSQARWSLAVSIAGSKERMKIAEAQGESMLRAGEAEV